MKYCCFDYVVLFVIDLFESVSYYWDVIGLVEIEWFVFDFFGVWFWFGVD